MILQETFINKNFQIKFKIGSRISPVEAAQNLRMKDTKSLLN